MTVEGEAVMTTPDCTKAASAAAAKPDMTDTAHPGRNVVRAVSGGLPGSLLRGPNAGIATGRPTEDDRTGRHEQDGWNSNT